MRCARIPAALLLLCLASCRTLQPPALDWPPQRAALQAVTAFQFDGRMAVSGTPEGFSAALHWSQQADAGEIALRSPLGLGGGARVHFDAQQLGFDDGRGHALEGEFARLEMAKLLGFEAPLSSLRYWLLGAPDPAAPAEERLDAAHRLAHLVQSGWQLDFADYARAGTLWLPGRVRARRGEVALTLRITHWALP
jgi:outer membrane lipoprotein LolB